MNDKPLHLALDVPDNVILINGHEIAYQAGGSLVVDSGAISTVWMNVIPGRVRVIVHNDKIVVDDMSGKDRRIYLKLELKDEPRTVREYFARHGFIVESHV